MLKKLSEQQRLSYHYHNGKKVIKNNKLNLFGKAIMTIDLIQTQQINKLQNITEVDLSHNSIYGLGEIGQFHNVQIINLANNKIIESAEIEKLISLPRLHSVFIKNNPFVLDKLPNHIFQFLMGLYTDVNFTSQQIQYKIGQIINQKAIIECFSNYFNKLQLHLQFSAKFKLENSYNDSENSIFPKIKRFFQLQIAKEIKIRKQFINKIKKQIIYDKKQLLIYLQNQSQIDKQRKIQIINKIHQLQQNLILKRLQNHKKMNKNISNRQISPTDSHKRHSNRKSYAQSVIKQHKNSVHLLMQSRINHLKKNNPTNESSPSKFLIEMNRFADLQQFQQNYSSILIKLNPVFHLLHSPIISLKSNQKQLLINNLNIVLKEKMKQVFKMSKMQREQQTLREQFTNLKKHLQMITQQVQIQQKNQHQKLKKMSKKCRQQSEKVEQLSQQLQKTKQQLLIQKKKNQDISNQINQLQIKISNYQKQADYQTIIKQKRQNSLKSQYWNILIAKAYHFNQLKRLKYINEQYEQKQLKLRIFNEIKTNAFINKTTNQLKCNKMKVYSKLLIHNLIKNKLFNKKYGDLMEQFKKRKQRAFFIHYRYSLLVHKAKKQKMANLIKRNQRKLKNIFIQTLKVLIQQKQQPQPVEYIQLRQKLLTHTHFKIWKKYLKNTFQKTQFLQKQYKLGLKLLGLNVFISKSRLQINLKAKIKSVYQFLIMIRKYKNYYNFSKTINRVLLKRYVNIKKLQMIKKYSSFQFFISSIRNIQTNKKIKTEQQKHQLLLRQKQAQQHKNKQQKSKKKIRLRLKHLLYSFNSKIRVLIQNRQKNAIIVEKNRYYQNIKIFISRLNSCYIKYIKIQPKLIHLSKSNRNTNNIKLFFQKLSININKLKLNNNKIAKVLMVKSLYRWKTYSIWCRMQNYRIKFGQLQPQIIKITQLQNIIADEKMILTEKLRDKQLIIEQYINKCKQYEYALYSKEVKYEKLKDIYAQTIRHNQLQNGDGINNYKNLNRQENISKQGSLYIKYLPLEIRNKIKTQSDYHNQSDKVNRSATTRHTLSKNQSTFVQINQFPNRIKNKQNTFDKYIHPAKRDNTLQQFSFLSSFKKF